MIAKSTISQTTLTRLGLLLLLLFAFAWRSYRLDFQSLWRDEVDAIRFSSEPFLSFASFEGLTAGLTRPGHNGPLYFVWLRGWRWLTGDSEFALRYFSVVAGVLLVALIYQVARRLALGRAAALLAALLAATSPYLLWYSQEAKMYTWLAGLVLLAIYAFQSAMLARRPGRWWALFVLATSLSFYIHILSPLMLVVYGLWGPLQPARWRRRWRGWLLSLGALTVPYLPLLLWQAPLLLEDFNSGHPFYPFSEQMSLLLHLYSVGILRVEWSLMAIVLTLFLALVGLFGRREGAGPRWRVGLWLAAPPLLVYLISLREPVFEDRYLIYILPAYYLLLAVGLVIVARYERWLAAALLLILVGLNLWSGWRQTAGPIKADFRGAVQAVEAMAATVPTGCGRDPAPAVMFQMPYLQHTYAYYAQQPFRPLEGIWSNDNRDPAAVAFELTQRTEGVQQLWLVLSEEDQWDRRQLTRQWLNEQAHLIDQAQFLNVEVYQYTFSSPLATPAAVAASANEPAKYTVYLPLLLCRWGG